ncbi:nitrilase-related carbon-nitrogen hydrolase [Prauserella alba]|uniref:Nitrilase family protein n=1 Tax=Prauserella alba TaxID=176898 RepID=A0ABN1VL91_9PSEU|nr:nitrilase-related carbon-nitrogen hydrolase [Prauserella alba]MCP2182814.1 putative amidohydrolase [Prauserella alba]
MTRVACAEFAPVVGDPVGNRRRVADWITRAREQGADLAVLPELATSGYVFADTAEARAAAMAADDVTLAEWARVAGEMSVVAGFCELGDDGALYNSAVVLHGGRVQAVYRKTHLWDRERLVFRPGAEPAPVVEVAGRRVGVLICYDLEFPEMPRSLALRGAELLVAPVNWPVVPRPEGERPPEVVQAMAAARTNRVFMAVCDRGGTERGQEWTRGTVVIDEAGWIVAGGDAATGEERLVVADLTLSRARNKAISAHNDVLSDRRPELYGYPDARGMSAG